MNSRERQLLREEVGDAEPRLCLRTKAKIDAGRWLRNSRAWLCVMEDELIVLAVARRMYFSRIPLSECQGTHYNHATGELVIEPGETQQFSRFRMQPRDALSILKLLKSEKQLLNTEH